MLLGISSYTFPWSVGVPGHAPPHPLNEDDLLARTRKLGLNLLQIGDNLPLHSFEQDRLCRLAEKAAQENIQLEVGARGLKIENVARYVKITRHLGARLLRFVVDDDDYHPTPATITAILREIAPELGGLTLGIENHDRFKASVLREIIENAGSDRIGVCLDTANSLGAGEGIESVAAILAPLTVNLHLKDFWIERVPHKMGFQVTGRPAGCGMLNLARLLEQLAPFKRCRTAVLELWPPAGKHPSETLKREEAWAGQSIEFLKPFFEASKL